jgi:hypothetical protein
VIGLLSNHGPVMRNLLNGKHGHDSGFDLPKAKLCFCPTHEMASYVYQRKAWIEKKTAKSKRMKHEKFK